MRRKSVLKFAAYIPGPSQMPSVNRSILAPALSISTAILSLVVGGIDATAALVTMNDTEVVKNDFFAASPVVRGVNDTTLTIRSDRRNASTDENDSVGIIRFEGFDLESGFSSSGSFLDLGLRQLAASGGFNGPVSLELYGVIDSAAEDTLDESTYAATAGDTTQAVDQSSNLLRETNLFDPDIATSILEPLDVLSFASVTGNDDTAIRFSGDAFDRFLSLTTQSPGNDDVAFIVRTPALGGENVVFQIDSSEFNRVGANAFAPTLTVTAVPEPSTFALCGLAGIGFLRRRRVSSDV